MSSGVRSLLDTSVGIELDLIDTDDLSDETAISAIALAELTAGPHAAVDEQERGRRQDRFSGLRRVGTRSRSMGRWRAPTAVSTRPCVVAVARAAAGSPSFSSLRLPWPTACRCPRGTPRISPAWKT